MRMKLISIQVGLPKEIVFNDDIINTGIFKYPIAGPVHVGFTNIDGDGHADLSVHGGVDKAVYAYSLDAYPWWQQKRPHDTFVYGAFGENLCFNHLPEDQLFVGDTYELGNSILQVVQPRFPCFKLGAKFNDMNILRDFLHSNRPGAYFSVLKEGLIDVGDELRLLDREPIRISVIEFFTLGRTTHMDAIRAREVLKIECLAPYQRKVLQRIIDSG
jgi:MOSC domain-containing protein YiiM